MKIEAGVVVSVGYFPERDHACLYQQGMDPIRSALFPINGPHIVLGLATKLSDTDMVEKIFMYFCVDNLITNAVSRV